VHVIGTIVVGAPCPERDRRDCFFLLLEAGPRTTRGMVDALLGRPTALCIAGRHSGGAAAEPGSIYGSSDSTKTSAHSRRITRMRPPRFAFFSCLNNGRFGGCRVYTNWAAPRPTGMLLGRMLPGIEWLAHGNVCRPDHRRRSGTRVG